MADTSLVFNILAREKVSKTFDSIKAKAAVAGAAIGAALSAQMANALEKSKVDALLAAQLGAGPEMAARLGDITGNLYSRGVVDSVETAASAIKATMQNALVPKDAANEAIEQTSAMVANMAMILEEEADKVAGTVAQMVRTGIAKSTEEAFDILAAGAQQGANKAQDLLDTLNEYPTILRTFGLNGKEMTGLLVQGLQAGARESDNVADALKELSLRAVDGSNTTKEAFEKLGLSAEEIAPKIAAGGPEAKKALQTILDKLRELQGTAEGAQVVQDLFGGPGEDLGAAIFALNVDKAAESLGNVEGAAKKASQTLEQSAGAKVEAFKRKLEIGLTNALGTVAGLLMDNADLIKGLAIVLGPIIGVVGAVVGIVKAWSIAQSALNLVLSANPIVLVVLAIGTLITILILAWKNSETFRKVVTGAWNAIKSAAQAVGNWFRNTLWPWIKGVWDKISSSVVGLKNKIVNTWNSVISFFKRLPGRISSIGARLWEGIKNGFRAAINWIIGKWNSIRFTIPSISTPFGTFGGGSIGVPRIPYLAAGGVIQRAGMAVVGEAGPELVTLPRGAQVSPLPRSGAGGEVVVRLVVDDTAQSDLLRMLRKMVRVEGRGNVQVAFGRG
mgnify:CR=1 FL=1